MRLFDDENSLSLTILGLHRISDEMRARVQAMFAVDPGMRLVEDEEAWLDIRIEARTAGGAWHADGDILELHDVPFIAGWLRALASGAPARPELYFEEPYLSFQAVGDIDSKLQVVVTLEGEFRPPRNPGMIGDPPDPSFEIHVTSAMLLAAAESLETELRRALT